MFQDRRVVVCVPCGRERFLRVLLPYLYNRKRFPEIDEIQLWVNTDVEADVEYIRAQAKADDRVRLIELGLPEGVAFDASRDHYQFNNSVYRFYRKTVEPNTLYFKVDDDIVYVHPGFFANAAAETLRNADNGFITLCNVVNVPLTTSMHQANKVLDTSKGTSDGDPRCPVACTDGKFAVHLHRCFMKLHKDARLGELMLPSFTPNRGVRIGAMCYLGETFRLFDGVVNYRDESDLTGELPRRLNREIRFVGDALCSHFAFSHQLYELEKTNLLKRYEALSRQENA